MICCVMFLCLNIMTKELFITVRFLLQNVKFSNMFIAALFMSILNIHAKEMVTEV